MPVIALNSQILNVPTTSNLGLFKQQTIFHKHIQVKCLQTSIVRTQSKFFSR